MLGGCGERGAIGVARDTTTAAGAGTFAYDLQFLSKRDSILLLHNGNSAVIVSPKYQAKVFTSTADGDNGPSFGWVHYKAFNGPLDLHMNAYGGEDRLWLGPEGGRFSLFFPPGARMEFANWKTPAAFDTEAWTVDSRSDSSVTLHKDMQLTNYAGTHLDLTVNRAITILSPPAIGSVLGLILDKSVHVVGYKTTNILTNTSVSPWTVTTGMPCMWMLDMFPPSPGTTIIIPYRQGDASKPATTDYFGEIPADRIQFADGILHFKADGKMRGKLGIHPARAMDVAGSYDSVRHILTIIQFDVDPGAHYLNQEWNTTKPPFSGDAVNAYNDGPLADGSQMGPFYELESVSPAAFLKPGESLTHNHAVFHFTGPESALDAISRQLLGVSVLHQDSTARIQK
ncbi:MAG TPA: DUF6786 family protein [Puia sp.]|nr:DUF6786 family protein [Puia sp.]